MSEAPFWRTELWHPLTLHFPVTLLLLATIIKLAVLFLRNEPVVFWNRVGSYMLYAGLVMAWLSIYTGDLADGIVSRKLCDPTVLKDHENAAYNLAYIFSVATALDLGMYLNLIKIRSRILNIILVLLMVAGSAFLVYTSHLGASVVYEQAGGVNVPTGDCAGF